MSKVKIRNWFNDTAESLGCKARIGGNGKRPKYYMWRGGIEKGYEVWHPVTMSEFVKLINKYPELH